MLSESNSLWIVNSISFFMFERWFPNTCIWSLSFVAFSRFFDHTKGHPSEDVWIGPKFCFMLSFELWIHAVCKRVQLDCVHVLHACVVFSSFNSFGCQSSSVCMHDTSNRIKWSRDMGLVLSSIICNLEKKGRFCSKFKMGLFYSS